MSGGPSSLHPGAGAGRLSGEIEETVGRCAGIVTSIAVERGLTGSDVDEVFQEVRIRLWKAQGRGENVAALPASYVYRTAMSAAIDIIRRRRARPDQGGDVEAQTVVRSVAATGSPETDLARSEAVRAVHEAVAGLIDSRRPVVRMYLAGYRLEEIASLLGWTPAKTRNLLYRGLDDLRQALTTKGLDPEGMP